MRNNVGVNRWVFHYLAKAAEERSMLVDVLRRRATRHHLSALVRHHLANARNHIETARDMRQFGEKVNMS